MQKSSAESNVEYDVLNTSRLGGNQIQFIYNCNLPCLILPLPKVLHLAWYHITSESFRLCTSLFLSLVYLRDLGDMSVCLKGCDPSHERGGRGHCGGTEELSGGGRRR